MPAGRARREGNAAVALVLRLLASVAVALRRVLAVALPLLIAACGSSTPASPSTSTTTTSVAPATLSETYTSTLPIGGVKFYSFTVVQNGTVNLTLTAFSGPSIDNTTTVDLSLGRPAGTGCTPATTVNVSTDTMAPQITGTYAPGVYCARVADTTGILPAAGSFTVTIEHS